jgi:hypothetical protein
MNTFDTQTPSGAPSARRLLVVGAVRDCATSIRTEVLRIREALSGAASVHWLLVESDSQDGTLDALARLADEIPHFRHLSLGRLASRFEHRTERLAFCRNAYVDEIRTNSEYDRIDYVVVADLDELNTRIDRQAVDSCWENTGWDMASANQDGPYYDVWTLRHREWSPNDCWAQYRFLSRLDADDERNVARSVHSRMVKVPASARWIEVDSAFGGFAIYRKAAMLHGRYTGTAEDGEPCCEHVPFNLALKDAGARLFINPRLINAGYTEHTRHFLRTPPSAAKGIRWMRTRAKRLLGTILGPETLEGLLDRHWRKPRRRAGGG